MIKCCYPFKGFTNKSITQGYNSNHFAVDFTAPYGTFMVAPFNCKISCIVSGNVLDNSVSGLESGYGIRMVSIEDPNVSVCYWHCLPVFPVSVGDTVLQGFPVAQMGNSGYVLSNSELVPLSKRLIPPNLGTHCHCSMNIKGESIEGIVDIRNYWDRTIEIKYDLKTTILSLINKIKNII